MNANKMNMADLSLDALIALKQQSAAIAEAVKGEVEAIREINSGVTDAKNAADAGNTLKSSLWGHVFSIVAKVEDATRESPDIRYQVFTDTLAEFLILPANADGSKPKMSTAGQYASTGRKLLIDVITGQGRTAAEFADKSVKEVRDLFKDKSDAAVLEQVGEAAKRLRYVVKHGKEEEKAQIAAILSTVEKLYMPVKGRKAKATKAAIADATLRDDRQQAPTEGATLETTAANLAGDDEGEEVIEKKAVNQ